MKHQKIIFALIAIAVAGAAGFGAYRAGVDKGLEQAKPVRENPSAANAAGGGKKPLYWHDPMVPGHKFDKPGRSPFMAMDLVPVYADEGADEGTVSISPRLQQNLGVRTAEATMGRLSSTLSAVGTVVYNERDMVLVQARSNGYVERLHVRAQLDPVKKGQPLAELYVPEWVGAQEEYLAARRMSAGGIDGLVEAARQRMRLAGMGEDHIRRVETTGRVQPRATITAPVGGVVAELSAREGMTVTNGAPLFRINGISSVWVHAEVPENAAVRVRPGASVEARTPALPGTVFKGKVSALLPEVNAGTRTLKARLELANPQGQLVPGMFATLSFAPSGGKDAVLVPSEAVIQTGTRSVVMLAQGEGKFSPVDVETGAEGNGQIEILKGIAAGQKVVVSGQFLIDSEASLKGSTARMGDGPAAPAAAPVHHAEGKLEHIGKDEVTISHGPVASLKWPEMTMGFKPPPKGMPRNVSVGDSVAFDFAQNKDGTFEIKAISPTAAAPGTRK